VTDRGTSFTSDEFEGFLKENNIRHVLVATGSPKANGQVERVNCMLSPLLAKEVDNSAGYWYKVLTEVEFAINNTIKSTGLLLFGVNQRGPNIDRVKEYLDDKRAQDDRDLEVFCEKTEKKIIRS